MPAIPVADPADPRLALYRGVRDPELLRHHGVFIAEGRFVVERLLGQTHFRVRSVLVTPAAHGSLDRALAATSCPVYIADQGIVNTIAGYNIHRGCLAVGERGSARTLDDLATSPRPLVVLERVGNPDNVGSTFRNAAAFGAAGVVLSPGCSDPLYRKAIRTSMAAALTVPFVTASEWPAPLTTLRATGRTLVALTLGERAEELATAAARLRGRPLALLLGHEGAGLTREAEELADAHVRIPIAPAADSLNVATAAAIALYEFRMRGLEGPYEQ